jgi:hypothetical protein
MPSLVISSFSSIDGATAVSTSTTVTSPSMETYAPIAALAAAPTGSLTTRSSGTAGTLTMASASHGITTGARMDVFWDGGSCYGATVGTVSGVSVPFTLAQGTALPVADTAVTACIPTAVTTSLGGSTVTGIQAQATTQSSDFGFNIVVAEADATTIYNVGGGLTPTTPSYLWNGSGTNPVTGATIGKVYFANGSSTSTRTGFVKMLYSA